MSLITAKSRAFRGIFNPSDRRVVTASVSKLTYGIFTTFKAVILTPAVYGGAYNLMRRNRFGIGSDNLLIPEEVGILAQVANLFVILSAA